MRDIQQERKSLRAPSHEFNSAPNLQDSTDHHQEIDGSRPAPIQSLIKVFSSDPNTTISGLPRHPPENPMERVQHMTKSAIRRASQIEVNPQTKRNLQELFVNFTLILICLLLIYIIVLLSS
ncbi:hypothetical protein CRUP_021229 [Coryphaenoides rupestris]|nr:hypothetical protein CRUP_021229 [Coryphaenoides rupestris]